MCASSGATAATRVVAAPCPTRLVGEDPGGLGGVERRPLRRAEAALQAGRDATGVDRVRHDRRRPPSGGSPRRRRASSPSSSGRTRSAGRRGGARSARSSRSTSARMCAVELERRRPAPRPARRRRRRARRAGRRRGRSGRGGSWRAAAPSPSAVRSRPAVTTPGVEDEQVQRTVPRPRRTARRDAPVGQVEGRARPVGGAPASRRSRRRRGAPGGRCRARPASPSAPAAASARAVSAPRPDEAPVTTARSPVRSTPGEHVVGGAGGGEAGGDQRSRSHGVDYTH